MSNNAEDEVLEWSVILESNGTNINYKLDTGSQVNILPKKEYTKLIHKPKLHPAKVKLTAYNGTDIPVVGKCIVTLKNGYQEWLSLNEGTGNRGMGMGMGMGMGNGERGTGNL